MHEYSIEVKEPKAPTSNKTDYAPGRMFVMKIRTTVTLIAITAILLIIAGCSRSGPSSNASSNEKTIKSVNSGAITISLSSVSGEIKAGENEVMLSFADASGKPVDMAAASLKFHMPAMGSMAEMNDVATLTTTDTLGRFRARINIEVAGSWEAMISFQGPRGTEQATMSVNAK
jgi:hypothetical protein